VRHIESEYIEKFWFGLCLLTWMFSSILFRWPWQPIISYLPVPHTTLYQKGHIWRLSTMTPYTGFKEQHSASDEIKSAQEATVCTRFTSIKTRLLCSYERKCFLNFSFWSRLRRWVRSTSRDWMNNWWIEGRKPVRVSLLRHNYNFY